MHLFCDKGALNFEPVNLTMFERREPRFIKRQKVENNGGDSRVCNQLHVEIL
jgi:hypothetical protein